MYTWNAKAISRESFGVRIVSVFSAYLLCHGIAGIDMFPAERLQLEEYRHRIRHTQVRRKYSEVGLAIDCIDSVNGVYTIYGLASEHSVARSACKDDTLICLHTLARFDQSTFQC